MILKPHQVRLRICKLLLDEYPEDPHWPTVAGIVARTVAEKYEADYRRCECISQQILEDEAAKEASKG